ncbi:MAG: type II secretion system protein [Sedimentisphaerales bacterium]
MNKRAGFTLVELLVVIAIIALLLAVLVPTLRRAQGQAKSVVCRSDLKQWDMAFNMYANANNGRFFPGYGTGADGYSTNTWAPGEMWMIKLRPYYGGVKGSLSSADKIRLCPKATKFLSTLPDWMQTTPFTAWGIDGEGGLPIRNGEAGLYGSYGINDWVHSRPPINGNPAMDREYWRNITSLKSPPRTVPVFGDSVWEGTNPMASDKPSSIAGKSGDGSLRGMWGFCIPRHGLTVDWVFLDLSVRKVPIKDLWTLKWSTGFDTAMTVSWRGAPWINNDWGN